MTSMIKWEEYESRIEEVRASGFSPIGSSRLKLTDWDGSFNDITLGKVYECLHFLEPVSLKHTDVLIDNNGCNRSCEYGVWEVVDPMVVVSCSKDILQTYSGLQSDSVTLNRTYKIYHREHRCIITNSHNYFLDDLGVRKDCDLGTWENYGVSNVICKKKLLSWDGCPTNIIIGKVYNIYKNEAGQYIIDRDGIKRSCDMGTWEPASDELPTTTKEKLLSWNGCITDIVINNVYEVFTIGLDKYIIDNGGDKRGYSIGTWEPASDEVAPLNLPRETLVRWRGDSDDITLGKSYDILLLNEVDGKPLVPSNLYFKDNIGDSREYSLGDWEPIVTEEEEEELNKPISNDDVQPSSRFNSTDTVKYSDAAMRFNDGKDELSYIVDADVAMKGMCKVFSFGAEKYARNNWKKGLEPNKVIDSLIRHLISYQCGEVLDPESGLPHVDHITCNAVFLATFGDRSVKR